MATGNTAEKQHGTNKTVHVLGNPLLGTGPLFATKMQPSDADPKRQTWTKAGIAFLTPFLAENEGTLHDRFTRYFLWERMCSLENFDSAKLPFLQALLEASNLDFQSSGFRAVLA